MLKNQDLKVEFLCFRQLNILMNERRSEKNKDECKKNIFFDKYYFIFQTEEIITNMYLNQKYKMNREEQLFLLIR
jgi:hypothetical protein